MGMPGGALSPLQSVVAAVGSSLGPTQEIGWSQALPGQQTNLRQNTVCT